jgi:hypothetical protein
MEFIADGIRNLFLPLQLLTPQKASLIIADYNSDFKVLCLSLISDFTTSPIFLK